MSCRRQTDHGGDEGARSAEATTTEGLSCRRRNFQRDTLWTVKLGAVGLAVVKKADARKRAVVWESGKSLAAAR